MRVRVLLFGAARDAVGSDALVLHLPDGATVATALQVACQQAPALDPFVPQCRVAVNAEYADPTTVLRDGDEVALIPPVSGGRTAPATERCWVALTSEPIDLTALFNFVRTPQAGAVVAFLGTVRDHHQGKQVVALTYDAYIPMAERELQRIAAAMLDRWSLSRVAIVHRVGTLTVGEIAVAILVAAPHRADAFDAARYAIERLKELVPIWKREHFADGTAAWVHPT